jgi:hypothetical protein
MSPELNEIVENLLREDPKARAAFYAIRARSSDDFAKAEIGRALLGCLWESLKGGTNRFSQVLNHLRDGRTAVELFPDCELDGDSS